MEEYYKLLGIQSNISNKDFLLKFFSIFTLSNFIFISFIFFSISLISPISIFLFFKYFNNSNLNIFSSFLSICIFSPKIGTTFLKLVIVFVF